MEEIYIFWKKKEKANDWFIDSVDILKPAIDNKRKANLANKQRATRATLQEAKEARKTTRRLVRQATNKYWTDHADSRQWKYPCRLRRDKRGNRTY